MYYKRVSENGLPDLWKEKLNKARAKGETLKLLEGVPEEKRREIIKTYYKDWGGFCYKTI